MTVFIRNSLHSSPTGDAKLLGNAVVHNSIYLYRYRCCVHLQFTPVKAPGSGWTALSSDLALLRCILATALTWDLRIRCMSWRWGRRPRKCTTIVAVTCTGIGPGTTFVTVTAACLCSRRRRSIGKGSSLGTWPRCTSSMGGGCVASRIHQVTVVSRRTEQPTTTHSDALPGRRPTVSHPPKAPTTCF